MKHSLASKVPVKFRDKIILTEDELYKDVDGIWGYTQKGYYVSGMGGGCHTLHEYNWNDFLKMMRTIKPCDCERCRA